MKFLVKFLVPALAAVALTSQLTFAQDTGATIPLNAEVSGNVELWHFWGSPVRRTAIRRVIAICSEQLPNVSVVETFKPFGDIWTANIAAVAAGSGMPGVIVADRPQLPRDARDGIYQNLGELTAGDGIDGSQFWPFTWNQSLYEGEPYGIPFETDVRVLYYNRTLFTEAGLDPENPPQTWDELWQAADALDVIAEDGTLERIAFNPLAGNGPPGIWMLNNGHEWLQDGRPVVDDPAVVETLEWINRWIERYGGYENLQRFSQGFSAPPNDIFMSGAVAMKVDTAGYGSQMNFYRPRIQVGEDSVELAWGVSQIPHNEGAESTSASGGFTLSIPTGAPNPEAAWEFIKCAASVPAQVSWARDTYAIPNGPEAARSPELTADPNWDMFITAIESVPPDSSTFVPEYPNWETELANRYEQVWGGSLSPQEMLEQAQAAIDQQIGQ